MGSSPDPRREPKFSRHLRGVFPSLEELFAAGEAVRECVSHPGWAHIARVLEAEIATIDRDLDGGSEPLSQAEYALAHGRRGGLRGAEDAAGAILHRYEMALTEQRAKHEGDAEPSLTGVGS